MNKTFILIFLINVSLGIANMSDVSAQTVFAPVGAKWYYSFPSHDTVDHYVLLESEKDTIVQGQNCQKIRRTDYKLFNGPNSTPYYDTSVGSLLFTYVSGDTVFYYHDLYQRFVPHFSFDVTEGDTIRFYLEPDTICMPLNNDSFYYGRVDEIDTVIVDNIPLRQIKKMTRLPMGNFNFSVSAPYMERIGALENYIFSYRCFNSIPEVYYPALRCYSDHEIFYNPGLLPCDYLSVSVPAISLLQSEVDIYPNPAGSIVHIGKASLPFDLNVKVYDVMGRLHKTQHCDKATGCIIDVNELNNGIYWMVMENTNIEFSKKAKLLIEK